MASTSTPYGLVPIADQSGPAPRNVRIPLGVASGYATNIFKGTPVTLNTATGTIQAVTATNQQIFGVFSGIEYTPTGGRPVVSPFWPSGTVYDTGYDMFVYIWPAWIPSLRFQIQANGSVAQALLGSQFNLANFTAGNTQTGLSAATVAAAGVGVGVQGQLALTEFADTTGIYGTIGDAFTDLIVTIAYPQVGSAFQTSIG